MSRFPQRRRTERAPRDAFVDAPLKVVRAAEEEGKSTDVADLHAGWRAAIELWLRWSEGHEATTAAMYAARDDGPRMAELMQRLDALDQLHWRAVELSQALLAGEAAPR